MTEFFWISYAVLWLLVVALLFSVSMLLRYHGKQIVREQEHAANRAAGETALTTGAAFPAVELPDATGRTWPVPPNEGAAGAVVVFMVGGCTLCADMVPQLNRFAGDHESDLSTLLVYSGTDPNDLRRVGDDVRVLFDQNGALMRRLRIRGGPYGVFVQRDGTIVRSGVVSGAAGLSRLVMMPLSET